MLEKLIANLKESLPEPLRKKLGMESNADDQTSEESEESGEDSHDTVAPEIDPKKKQLSMIIRVIVVLALGYLAIDQFFLTPEDNTVVDVPIKPRKRRPKVTPPAATEAVVAGNGAVTDPAAAVTPPAETPPVVADTAPVPPVENINIAEKTDTAPVVAAEPVVPDSQIVPEAPVAPVNPVTPEVLSTEPAATVGEVKSETQIDKSLDSLIDSVDGKNTNEVANTEKKETKLEDKIVADDVYTPPPAYDQLGRGLVYNCKEKYWACIDKMAYVTCNKNMKWNQSHTKPAECVVQNVYNSDDDCSLVQKHNVSTSKATPFCQ